MKAKMLDESWWQKDIVDHAAAKADGYECVIIRASHGFRKDEYFVPNVLKARDADMVVGAYHYLYVDCGLQVQTMIDQLEDVDGVSTAVFLDVERYSNESATVAQWRQCINDNVKLLEDNGFCVGFYSSMYMWQLCTNNMAEINGKPASEYTLWTAHWADVANPLLPYPWREWEFWQQGSTLKPAWAQGNNIDFGVANMTPEELRKKYLDEDPITPDDDWWEELQILKEKIGNVEQKCDSIIRWKDTPLNE